jgi:hypothetical protein
VKKLKSFIFVLSILFTLSSNARFMEYSSVQEESTYKAQIAKAKKDVKDAYSFYKSKALSFWQKAKKDFLEDKTKTNESSPAVNNAKNIKKSNASPQKVVKEEVPQKAPLPQVLDDNGQVLIPMIPAFVSNNKKESQSQIKESSNTIKNKNFTSLKRPAVKPDVALPLTKSGVAYFNLYNKKKTTNKAGKVRIKKIKVTSLPKLNPGRPAELSSQDFIVQNFESLKPNYKLAKPLKGPGRLYKDEVRLWKRFKQAKIGPARQAKRKDFGLDLLVNEKRIAKALAKIETLPLDAEKEYFKYSKNHLKMLSATILYKRGNNCHVVSGLFHDISNIKEYKRESNYYLGLCSHEMGFYSESTTRLLKVVKAEDPELSPIAIKVLIKDLPVQYELTVARVLMKIKNKALIPDEARDGANYVLSRAYSIDLQFKIAKSFSEKVSKKSKYYHKAQFILGVSDYALERHDQSIARFVGLRKYMLTKKIDDSKLSSLIALNMGRIYFRQKKFKQSSAEFLKVDKNSPYWVQALVEQGWSQLMAQDASGAIGNMYSLHSPYFKAVYKPDSYVVRTIGYLNICQYGDAYQTLKLMEERYKPWVPKIGNYLNKKKKNLAYYNLVKKYLTGKSTKNIEGLPYQLIREMARHRDFLSLQSSLNQKEDELDQYRFINSLIIKDKAKLRWRGKKAKKRLAKYRGLIKKAKVKKELLANVNVYKAKVRLEKDLIAAMRFQLQVYEEGRQGFFRLKKKAFRRIAKEKNILKLKAGRVLKRRTKLIHAQLKHLINNNELLRYEAYAGSGQNIRFQVAGGKVTKKKATRIPASMQPQKTLSWSVTGEYWEDEIGNYRSALKNNCPEFKNKKINFKNHAVKSGEEKKGSL